MRRSSALAITSLGLLAFAALAGLWESNWLNVATAMAFLGSFAVGAVVDPSASERQSLELATGAAQIASWNWQRSVTACSNSPQQNISDLLNSLSGLSELDPALLKPDALQSSAAVVLRRRSQHERAEIYLVERVASLRSDLQRAQRQKQVISRRQNLLISALELFGVGLAIMVATGVLPNSLPGLAATGAALVMAWGSRLSLGLDSEALDEAALSFDSASAPLSEEHNEASWRVAVAHFENFALVVEPALLSKQTGS